MVESIQRGNQSVVVADEAARNGARKGYQRREKEKSIDASMGAGTL